jgi:diacylglycerol kinase (ATP)
VIANPVSGRRRSSELRRRALALFAEAGIVETLTTRAAGDEYVLAKNAIARGTRCFIVLGGDGTCSKVAGAILDSNVDCALGVVPTGTGNDFAKTLGVEGFRAAELAAFLDSSCVTRIDVGRVGGHYLVNTCGFGFDPSVLSASAEVPLLRGNSVYVYSALKQLFTYTGVDVGLNDASRRERILMAVLSNGSYLGGVFNIAPQASVLDGMLDLHVFSNCGPIERARLFASAMKGSHVRSNRVTYTRAGRFVLNFSVPPMMEIDGELRQAVSSTVEIQCLPRALSVIAAPGFPR